MCEDFNKRCEGFEIEIKTLELSLEDNKFKGKPRKKIIKNGDWFGRRRNIHSQLKLTGWNKIECKECKFKSNSSKGLKSHIFLSDKQIIHYTEEGKAPGWGSKR